MDDDFDVDAYFARIGHSGDRAPTLATLSAIHALHPGAIAFENLDPLLGRPVALDLASLQAKLVRGRRGGYCFEQNALFQAALEALGFRVQSLIARVLWNRPSDAPAPPRSHMLLRVDLPEGPFLADVGFGGHVQTAPLRLATDVTQKAGSSVYRLADAGGALELETKLSGVWRKVVRFDLEPQAPIDFEVANWFTSTHPASQFVSNLIMARVGEGERYALRNRDFIVRRQDGAAETRELRSRQELADVLEGVFKVTPPAPPEEIFRRLP